MAVNLASELIVASLFFACFIVVYLFVRNIIYDGTIKIDEHGTNKYIFTLICIVVISIVLTILVLWFLKIDSSLNLLSYIFNT